MNIREVDFVKVIKPYILECRLGDWEHAKRVVGWVKKLGKNRKDLILLVVAAYLHDIGWFGLVNSNRKLTRKKLLNIQPKADAQTNFLVRKVLGEFNLIDIEIKKILRLIKSTETYNATQEDEMILVDADNLSKTATAHVKEKYAKSDWLAICDLFEEKLPERIKTKMGKKLFSAKLRKLREDLIKELKTLDDK